MGITKVKKIRESRG